MKEVLLPLKNFDDTNLTLYFEPAICNLNEYVLSSLIVGEYFSL